MSDQNHADLIIIGAGPAGYVAAIRAAQLGMNVTVVEKQKTLGGTCLNVGCIPSKILLNASEKYHEVAAGHLEKMGIESAKPKLNIKAMMNNKNDIVKSLTEGIDFLFRKNKITRLLGTATIKAAGQVSVKDGDKTQEITGDKILIAAGSLPTNLTGITIDEDKIVSSTGALEFTSVPKKLALIGAGYIGLEMAAVWNRLGAEVEVIEYLPRILPGMDAEIAKKFQKILEKQGIKLRLNTAVKGAKTSKNGVAITVQDKDNNAAEITADKLIVAVGRKPHTDGLGLENTGVEINERGQIIVDEKFQTNVAGIFAIGDIIPGPMLAHKAEEDGIAAIEMMAEIAGHVDYNLVPGIVYTTPEVASIGKTEEQLIEAGIKYNKGTFPMQANSRARAIGQAEGIVKILADEKTDQVLGVHIIAHEAGTIIHECATAMAFSASSEDIARTCHGHPTLNEAVKEAALATYSKAIHN